MPAYVDNSAKRAKHATQVTAIRLAFTMTTSTANGYYM